MYDRCNIFYGNFCNNLLPMSLYFITRVFLYLMNNMNLNELFFKKIKS